MINNNKILAIIPARGGSKEIPNKNIINVKGKPLIDYTIKEALNSQYIDRLVVSTDSFDIAEIAQKCGADVPFLRDATLAADKSRIIDVVLSTIENLDRSYDYVVLLQPTQPLRLTVHIDEAIEEIVGKDKDSLLSINLVKDHPILIREINPITKKLTKLLALNSTVRRQEFPDYYKVNGAIYINKINENLNETTSLNDNEIGYEMDPKYDVDIDDYIDLEVFKIMLEKLESNST